MNDYLYIDSRAQLEQLIPKIRGAARVALDTEADSLHNYRPKVCLIQFTIDGQNCIVDPLSDIDLIPMLDLFAQKKLIFHGADYDLRMLKDTFSFKPGAPVFDTMLAAKLLGYKELGLTALVKRFFNITLSKHGQKSDWSRRPLTPAQIEYAIADVHYLEPLADLLDTELNRQGRRGWHQESCERMVKSTGQRVEKDRDTVWRIKGCGKFSRLELLLVRELWHWREGRARKIDVPPFKVMGDKLLLDLAVWAASHPKNHIESYPSLPRNIKESRLRSLSETVKRAKRIPSSKWPRLSRKTHKRRPRLLSIGSLIARRNKVAHQVGIEPATLATKASLEAIARSRPRTIEEIMSRGSLMRWQAELLEPEIIKVEVYRDAYTP